MHSIGVEEARSNPRTRSATTHAVESVKSGCACAAAAGSPIRVFLFLHGRNTVTCDGRSGTFRSSRTHARGRNGGIISRLTFRARKRKRHGCFPCFKFRDDDRPARSQHQTVGLRFETGQSVEHPLFRTRRKADGDQLSAVERFERTFGRFERPYLRTDGKGRPFVGFPEKPLAVEDDAVGILRFGSYEIFARHGSNSTFSCLVLSLYGTGNLARKIEKFFRPAPPVNTLRLQAAGNKSNKSNQSNGRFAPILGRDARGSRGLVCICTTGVRSSSIITSNGRSSPSTARPTNNSRCCRRCTATLTSSCDSPKQERIPYFLYS